MEGTYTKTPLRGTKSKARYPQLVSIKTITDKQGGIIPKN
jgi:hypothetical protein